MKAVMRRFNTLRIAGLAAVALALLLGLVGCREESVDATPPAPSPIPIAQPVPTREASVEPPAMTSSVPSPTPQAPTDTGMELPLPTPAVSNELVDPFVGLGWWEELKVRHVPERDITHYHDPCGPARVVLAAPPYEHFVHWTEDGDYLVFDIDDTIWTVDVTSGKLRAVADVDADYRYLRTGIGYRFLYGFYADASPDGSRIVYATCEHSLRLPNTVSGPGYDIAMVNVDGTGRKRLTQSRRFVNYPVWSPEGKRIAMIVQDEPHYESWLDPREWPYLVIIEEGNALRLRPDGPIALYPPVWSPDGQYLAFLALDRDPAVADSPHANPVLQTIHSNGTFPTAIAETTAPPTWSPESDALAFAAIEGEEVVIYTVQPDGTAMQQVWRSGPDGPSLPIEQLAWSPDGTELLFVSGGVYLIQPDGEGLRSLPLPLYGTGARVRASWSPGGSRIAVYVPGTPRNRGGSAPDFDVTAIQLLTISRDGRDRRVVMDANDLFLSACLKGTVFPGPYIPPGLASDCTVLLGLRDELAGPRGSSGLQVQWNAQTQIFRWPGVTVLYGRVFGVAVSGSNLNGVIPSSIGELSHLDSLNLSGNSLHGAIPLELGMLRRLNSLNLANNNLTESIPPELGNLGNLEALDLADNDLSGPIPPELGNLAYLEVLDLSNNDLSGPLSPELARLENLRTLRIQGNAFTGCVPVELPEIWVEQSGLERCGSKEGNGS